MTCFKCFNCTQMDVTFKNSTHLKLGNLATNTSQNYSNLNKYNWLNLVVQQLKQKSPLKF